MSASPDPSSVPANERATSAQQSQPQTTGDQLQADRDAQLFDGAGHRAQPDAGGAMLVDDAPTIQLLPGQAQLAVTSGTDRELAARLVLRSRYVLEDVIGHGGSSIIYRATDLHRASAEDLAANCVAIKLLRTAQRTDPLALERLQREFQQMQRLSHTGIVRVFDLDCDGDLWFISMELVAGRTVKAWIQAPGSQKEAPRIIDACCEALEHAHSLGIVHGDLKPSNVMVTDSGAVKLIDFGSAPSPSGSIAARLDTNRAGTPLYASPQVLSGQAPEPRDDVFSLACLSYGILSGGKHPFGMRPSLEDGRAKSAPTYVRTIPPRLFEVIERGLSAEAARRQASVAEFRRELSDADRRRGASAGSATTPARDKVGALHRPSPITHAVDTAPHSTLPTVFKATSRGERGFTTTAGTGLALAVLHRVGGSRGSYRRARPFVGLMALIFAAVGAAVLLRPGPHRDVVRTAILPAEATATSLEPVPAATTQGAASADTGSVRQDSGVISFEAPTIHASAMQSLVAISVKRLHATRSRGAFVWRVEQGTAQPGIDYPRMEPQVVKFTEGQAVRTLFIPLLNSHAPLLPRSPRTFTVTLERVAGGPALGRLKRVTVALDPPPTSSRPGVYQARTEQ